MPGKTLRQRQLVATIGATVRHDPDSPELDELRRDLAVEGVAEHIKRVVDGMPPLSDEHLSRLVVLLRGGSDG